MRNVTVVRIFSYRARSWPPDDRRKHGRDQRRRLAGEEPQGTRRAVHVRRGRVPGRSARRGSAEGRPPLYRHAQRADRVLCRRRRRLPDRPPRLVHRRDRSRRHPRPRRPRQRAAELLADAVDRRRIGDLPQRHGRLPGRAPGAGRDAALQMGARHRARAPHPVLCGDGGQAIDLRPAWRHLSRHRRTTSSPAHATRTRRSRPRNARIRRACRRCRSTSSRR